jgi:hypothetical protein
MTDSERAATEIMELFERAGANVSFVNPLLFHGKSVEHIKIIKERIRAVLDRYFGVVH